MKIQTRKEQGAILVTTMVVCAVLGITLGLTMLWATMSSRNGVSATSRR